MASVWRTVLSDETRTDIFSGHAITSGMPIANTYEVYECGCTVILDEGAFVLCVFHRGFEDGVLAVSRMRWRRRR